MLIGYARVSTVEQDAGYEAQRRELLKIGCEKLFCEKVSGVSAHRPQLEAALDMLRSGDVLVTTKPDRLARSVEDLLRIVRRVKELGASVRILSMDFDTGTPTGKLMLTVMGGIAEFERELMKERQREGVAKAKAEGKYKGRAPTARAKRAKVLELAAQGVGATDIAREVGIGRASVYRLLTVKPSSA